MTHPKQTLTPGQAAREAYDSQCTCGDFYPADWDAIALAAIEAFLKKQSGDRPAFRCPRCGEPCSSNGCSCQPTPPTENKDEREHAREALRYAEERRLVDSGRLAEFYIDCVVEERAAADKAAYERGRTESGAVELADSLVDATTRLSQLQEDQDAMHALAIEDERFRKLQSSYERLTAAARDNIAEWQSYVDDPETAADSRCAYSVCIANTQAALAETEEKKT